MTVNEVQKNVSECIIPSYQV